MRYDDEQLAQLLEFWQVMTHSFVITELALGSLKNREKFLKNLDNLPKAMIYQDDINAFIKQNNLYSLGIGFVDVHLLASCQIMGIKLWTKEKRLANIATKLGLSMISIH
ncbi:hypothetical protein ACGTJS_00380 [Faucicola mancuniensis]|uniref:hypothetical protein n=1 Tax=Faucicola mancuniensis TaxID=1309795 RepID=UPI0039775CE9